MIRTLAPLLAGFAALIATSAPAMAQDSRTYFTARITQSEVPRQLSSSEREYYDALFTAIERSNWGEVERLLGERERGLLHDVARAEYYLAASSPRVELPQIERWLETGSALPQAAQLGRLGVTRGAAQEPNLPRANSLQGQGGLIRRVRPRPIDDGTMPSSISAAIQERIVNDDPQGARELLYGIDANLSYEARAEWRQRVAWSFFIENMDQQALDMALTVQEGDGPWVAEGDWVAGLAAWRLGDCEVSSQAFQRAAYRAQNPTLRAASLYWGARAAMRCRQPGLADRLLNEATGSDDTLYGMLANEQLGRTLPDRVETADFTDADWREVGDIENIRITAALAEIGRDGLASEVLMHQASIGDPRHYELLSRLARSLGFPQTQLRMAYNAPSGGRADPASYYPAPKIQPSGGWQIDPALAFAHILQESAFRPDAVSPASARGLMQITPITVRQHADCVGRPSTAIDVFDQSTNLALGQCNIQMLQRDSATGGRLPKMMAAYNAGLTPVRRWENEINDQNDPLLYMEAIPYWETREYVAIVTRNYWMYERQARAASSSRQALAQNDWPLLTNGQAGGNGRVYFLNGAE